VTGTAVIRAPALDALRGIAILAMVLVALQPSGALPAWMYHAQTPPPTHDVVPALDGLTWPDVVFPAFLFALGAAIPFALGRRLDGGEPKWKVATSVVVRGALLLFFAVFRQHFDASVSPIEPVWLRHAFALAGFLALFGVFTRLPVSWPAPARLAVRVSSWATVALMFVLVRFPDGSGASLVRADYILKALAHAAVLGSLVWLVTRHHLMPRLATLAAVAAFRMAAWRGGWASDLWNLTPFEAPMQIGFVVYLCAVIPGTIIGDAMLGRARLVPTLVGWGAAWLILGVALAILDEGLNKTEGSLSWFFTTTGLSIAILLVLVMLMDVWHRRWKMGLFVDNGQNPMIGYVANGMLLLPLMDLTGVKAWLEAITASPALGLMRAVILTVLIAFVVRFFTRRRLLWRT
jgi:hypothetical protein